MNELLLEKVNVSLLSNIVEGLGNEKKTRYLKHFLFTFR